MTLTPARVAEIEAAQVMPIFSEAGPIQDRHVIGTQPCEDGDFAIIHVGELRELIAVWRAAQVPLPPEPTEVQMTLNGRRYVWIGDRAFWHDTGEPIQFTTNADGIVTVIM